MNRLNATTKYKGVIYAMVTAFLWGFLPIFLKVALQDIDPISIVWFRFSFAFAVLFLYYLFTDRKQLNIIKRPPLILIIAAIALGVNYIGFLQGLNYTSPSNAQIIIQSGPIMLALAGVIFFKERLNLKQMIGFGIAGIGLFLFYRNQLQEFIHDTNAFNLGFFWVELAAVTWVLYAVLQKKLVQQYPAQVLNMVLYGIPALIYTPMADFSAFSGLDLKTWAIVIFLGINTLIAYGSIALAFKYTEAYKVSIIVTLNPIITLLTMAVLAKLQVDWIQTENLNLFSLIGAILVIGGAVTAVFFSREKKKKAMAKSTT
ncbi:DMT family transporter [Marinifilum caeruleilacunae]|uniref:DMT family transporter n=1 Tax=Marinifilum caeruleilacunae TaxID=2499076 RepID=A0ABX1WUJ8_9BACT|nr:DMT family transporter [Marinifilum caeruleilacunae]NOU59757.1 DMT family transporter [Marinifilum caeruleilacunae]